MSAIELPPPFVGEELKNPTTRTCAVIGGRGFLGRSLVSRLLHLADWIVRVADFDQSLSPGPDDSMLLEAVSSGRASYHCLDLLDTSLIAQAIEGSSVVFYMESTNLQISDFYQSYMIIVQGAKNVITACRECKVRRLIYNSSADVVFDGSHDIHNGDESLPCQWRFDDMLTDLKAQAESLILFANNIDGLLTCALRPSIVFGPGETEIVPLLVNLAKSGLAKLIIGNGENVSDFIYYENVTHAHICAAKALDSQLVYVAGKAFFISNLEPVNFWDFVSLILEGLGYQRPLMKIPARAVWPFLLVIKWMHEQMGSISYNHYLLAKVFHLAWHTRTFNCSAAQKHIGYSPVVSMVDGIALTIKSFKHLAKDADNARNADFDDQSKADKLLGGGKVADILLWRDEKTTFTYFLALVMLFYWFWLSGMSFTSSAAKLLLLVVTILYGYGMLPPKISNVTVPEISSYCFEVQGSVVRDTMASLACLWNRCIYHLRLLSRGEDWEKFCKVALSLYFLKLFLLQSMIAVISEAVVFAFTAFFVYEQYESEIDGFTTFLVEAIKWSFKLLMSVMAGSLVPFLQNKQMLHDCSGPDLPDD